MHGFWAGQSLRPYGTAAPHGGDKDQLIAVMQDGFGGNIGPVDGAERAFDDGLQAWIASQQGGARLADGNAAVKRERFLALPGDFTKRCKVTNTYIHVKSISFRHFDCQFGQRAHGKAGRALFLVRLLAIAQERAGDVQVRPARVTDEVFEDFGRRNG